jgi:RNA polymerase sigma-70 factor (ECF subfamily)
MKDEKTIIEEIMAGQTDQYRLLVEKYQNPVFRVIFKIVGNDDDARDLTQDVFVKIYESLHQYNSGYKFFSWVYRTAINKALLFERRKKKFLSIDGNSGQFIQIPDQRMDYESRDELLNQAINGLTVHYRTVVLLKYYAGLSYADISEILGIPEKTVKSRLFDARKMLKDRLIKSDLFSFIQYN